MMKTMTMLSYLIILLFRHLLFIHNLQLLLLLLLSLLHHHTELPKSQEEGWWWWWGGGFEDEDDNRVELPDQPAIAGSSLPSSAPSAAASFSPSSSSHWSSSLRSRGRGRWRRGWGWECWSLWTPALSGPSPPSSVALATPFASSPSASFSLPFHWSSLEGLMGRCCWLGWLGDDDENFSAIHSSSSRSIERVRAAATEIIAGTRENKNQEAERTTKMSPALSISRRWKGVPPRAKCPRATTRRDPKGLEIANRITSVANPETKGKRSSSSVTRSVLRRIGCKRETKGLINSRSWSPPQLLSWDCSWRTVCVTLRTSGSEAWAHKLCYWYFPFTILIPLDSLLHWLQQTILSPPNFLTVSYWFQPQPGIGWRFTLWRQRKDCGGISAVLSALFYFPRHLFLFYLFPTSFLLPNISLFIDATSATSLPRHLASLTLNTSLTKPKLKNIF